MLNSSQTNPKSGHSYILRYWQEDGVWRYLVVDVAQKSQHGFLTLADALAEIEQKISKQTASGTRTGR